MRHQLFFRINNFCNPVSVLGGRIESRPCEKCKRSRITWIYNNLAFEVAGIEEWPLVFGGIYHTAVRQNIVDAFRTEGITGAKFYPLEIRGGEVMKRLSKPPDYYILEPSGIVDIHIPWDEFSKCEDCGLVSPSQHGAFKRPFSIDWASWDGSDVVGLRNVYPFWICCNRKVEDLFRSRGWHHLIAHGRQNRKYESLQFGGNPVPGVGVRNIDSTNWYDETLAAMREKYPDWQGF